MTIRSRQHGHPAHWDRRPERRIFCASSAVLSHLVTSGPSFSDAHSPVDDVDALRYRLVRMARYARNPAEPRLPNVKPRADSAHRRNAISRKLAGEGLRGLHLQQISTRYAAGYSSSAGHVRRQLSSPDTIPIQAELSGHGNRDHVRKLRLAPRTHRDHDLTCEYAVGP
jgi:hypothetical protein